MAVTLLCTDKFEVLTAVLLRAILAPPGSPYRWGDAVAQWGTALQAGRSQVGIFHNPSGRTMALGLTQPLTEMSTRNIYWG